MPMETWLLLEYCDRSHLGAAIAKARRLPRFHTPCLDPISALSPHPSYRTMRWSAATARTRAPPSPRRAGLGGFMSTLWENQTVGEWGDYVYVPVLWRTL